MMPAENALVEQQPPAPEQVISWLVSGATEAEISQALAAKYPGTDPAATLATVHGHLRAAGNPDADCLRGWLLLCQRRLYAEMLRIGDFSGCRQVLDSIAKLAP